MPQTAPARSTDLPPKGLLNRSHLLRFGGGLALAAVVLFFIARALGPLRNLGEAALEIDSRWIGVAVFTAISTVLLSGLRMKWALSIQGDHVSFWSCLRAVIVCWPIGAISPARTGDFVRAAHVNVPLKRGISSILAEKVIDVGTLLFVGGWGALYLGRPGLTVVSWSILALALLGIFAPRRPLWLTRWKHGAWLSEKMGLFLTTTRLLVRHKRQAFLLIVSSFGGVSLACLHLGVLLTAVGANIPALEIAHGWPLSMIAGGLPFTPAGLGTRDAAFIALLAPERREPAVLLATLLYGLTPWVISLLSLPLLIRAGIFGSRNPSQR